MQKSFAPVVSTVQKGHRGSVVGGKLKPKVSEVCFGMIAVFVDVAEHSLVIRFLAPTESLELEHKRLTFQHTVAFHELEYYFGAYRESERTRGILSEVL